MPFRVALLMSCLLACPVGGGEVSFRKQIAPLLTERCAKCHSGAKARGGLRVTTRATLIEGGAGGPALAPGKSADSLIFQHVRDKKMPPRQPLSTAEVDLLRAWIDSGAKWEGAALVPPRAASPTGRAGPDWWSLQPIRRRVPPAVKDASLVRTSIDSFLLAGLESRGLTFSPEADRRTLIRRVSFDLIGLPPSPEEINSFVSDSRPDAYERLVDRLLASPHYGERWARHWLDVVRFAESHGYEMNTLRPNAWPYRDYIIRAFNDDIPYRQFVMEQLAGDVAGKDDLASAATGFLVAGPHDMVGNATVEGKLQMRSDDLFDLVANTGGTFLGLTAGCARCHDHKFDPISQKEFYALQAVFAGVEHSERDIASSKNPRQLAECNRVRKLLAAVDSQLDDRTPLANGKSTRPPVDPLRNVERFRAVKARSVRFVINETFDGSEPCLDELELYGPGCSDNQALQRGVKLSASSVYPNNPLHRLEHINDGKIGNSRSWISAERGKGWVRLDLPAVTVLDRAVWGRDREGRFRDRLARTYRIEVSLDGTAWTTVAGSSDRGPAGAKPPDAEVRKLLAERDRLSARLRALTSPRRIYAGSFRSPDVTHLLKRGDVMQKLQIVGPGGIASVRPPLKILAEAPEQQRRLTLAEWIAHGDNPLAARVLVNRLWHWHFGQGLVRTPSDFGCNGDRPSHPELLDFLATELKRAGGRSKPLHRLMVLSRAYRQSSLNDSRCAAIDADNRLLWRGPSRRLEAESIRDAMLQVSGALDTRMGGPGYHLWDYSGYVIDFKPKPKFTAEAFRRMVYQFKPRLQQDRTFGEFDCPDATAATPKRNSSTTPLQALNLLNDPFVLDQAERFANRVKLEAGAAVGGQVRRAFFLAVGRPPTSVEAKASEKLVRDHGLAVLCRVLFNINEFVFVH